MKAAGQAVLVAAAAGALGGTAALAWTRDIGQALTVSVVGTAVGTAIYLAIAGRTDNDVDATGGDQQPRRP
ncbi:MAG: hypothetical protein ACK5OX_13435 [Desertimonas sp.]